MIGDLIAVIKEMQNAVQRLATAKREKRQALANYLDKVAECIDDICDQKQAGHDLRGKCAELETYGAHSSEILNSMAQGSELAERIRQATFTRRGLAVDALLPENPTDEQIANLRSSAGTLRGTANILRAS